MKEALCSLILLLVLGCGSGCGSSREGIILYTSQDQFFAEPILHDFTAATGIPVKTVFDSESAKTAGLANRLRQEAAHPRCDLFWSNEEMHTRVLVRDSVIQDENVRSLGYRTRRLVINTNLVKDGQVPKSLLELTNNFWRGRIALAYPLYGTTGSHFIALRQLWGEAIWKHWCEALVANGAKVVDGNSVVVKLVGGGEAWIGLTDSDDVAAGKRAGLPVEATPLTREMLVIPNTVALVRPNGMELMNYIAQPSTMQRLVTMGALDGINADDVEADCLRVDWPQALSEVDKALRTLKEIFLRS